MYLIMVFFASLNALQRVKFFLSRRMSFFKKGKYKLYGKSSKNKEKEPTKENFFRTDGPSTSRNGNYLKGNSFFSATLVPKPNSHAVMYVLQMHWKQQRNDLSVFEQSCLVVYYAQQRLRSILFNPSLPLRK